jgi:hypothetical protein
MAVATIGRAMNKHRLLKTQVRLTNQAQLLETAEPPAHRFNIGCIIAFSEMISTEIGRIWHEAMGNGKGSKSCNS